MVLCKKCNREFTKKFCGGCGSARPPVPPVCCGEPVYERYCEECGKDWEVTTASVPQPTQTDRLQLLRERLLSSAVVPGSSSAPETATRPISAPEKLQDIKGKLEEIAQDRLAKTTPGSFHKKIAQKRKQRVSHKIQGGLKVQREGKWIQRKGEIRMKELEFLSHATYDEVLTTLMETWPLDEEADYVLLDRENNVLPVEDFTVGRIVAKRGFKGRTRIYLGELSGESTAVAPPEVDKPKLAASTCQVQPPHSVASTPHCTIRASVSTGTSAMRSTVISTVKRVTAPTPWNRSTSHTSRGSAPTAPTGYTFPSPTLPVIPLEPYPSVVTSEASTLTASPVIPETHLKPQSEPHTETSTVAAMWEPTISICSNSQAGQEVDVVPPVVMIPQDPSRMVAESQVIPATPNPANPPIISQSESGSQTATTTATDTSQIVCERVMDALSPTTIVDCMTPTSGPLVVSQTSSNFPSDTSTGTTQGGVGQQADVMAPIFLEEAFSMVAVSQGDLTSPAPVSITVTSQPPSKSHSAVTTAAPMSQGITSAPVLGQEMDATFQTTTLPDTSELVAVLGEETWSSITMNPALPCPIVQTSDAVTPTPVCPPVTSQQQERLQTDTTPYTPLHKPTTVTLEQSVEDDYAMPTNPVKPASPCRVVIGSKVNAPKSVFSPTTSSSKSAEPCGENSTKGSVDRLVLLLGQDDESKESLQAAVEYILSEANERSNRSSLEWTNQDLQYDTSRFMAVYAEDVQPQIFLHSRPETETISTPLGNFLLILHEDMRSFDSIAEEMNDDMALLSAGLIHFLSYIYENGDESVTVSTQGRVWTLPPGVAREYEHWKSLVRGSYGQVLE